MTRKQELQNLIERPGESLSVEIKRWSDIDDPVTMAKVIKAVIAMRNHGGGKILIGFMNTTLEPDKENTPDNIQVKFHIDKIQGMITKYSSEAFEIEMGFPERDGQLYPIIIVPAGVKTPVATKKEFKDNDGKIHFHANTIFVRSLTSNNTPSTTMATWKDLPNLMDICFENREADIGRFIRRHLSGMDMEKARTLLSAVSEDMNKPKTEEILNQLLQTGEERCFAVMKERGIEFPDYGTWEIGLLLDGTIPHHSANLKFLNLIQSNNPQYTGWPVWYMGSQFEDKSLNPYFYKDAWESLISIKSINTQMDFLRIDPKGEFYQRRVLEDDLSRSPDAPKPMTELDFGLPIFRIAEALAVGISFAKAMGCDPENTLLAFLFRWKKLEGRTLTSWANHWRFIMPGRKAYKYEVSSYVEIPLMTSLSALGVYVNQAVEPLFEAFEGFRIHKDTVEELTRKVINRQW